MEVAEVAEEAGAGASDAEVRGSSGSGLVVAPDGTAVQQTQEKPLGARGNGHGVKTEAALRGCGQWQRSMAS